MAKSKRGRENEGRPIEYKEEHTQAIYKYLDDFEKLGDLVPSIEGLADYLEVSNKTIYNWCQLKEDETRVASPEFLHALERLVSKQARTLQNKGLSGAFNPTITKLLLSAKHGLREKSDITTNDNDIALGGVEISIRK